MKFSLIRNHRQEPRADRVGSAWSTFGKRGALRRPRWARAATFASIRPELLVDHLLESPWAGDGECAVDGAGLIDGGPAGVAEGGGDRLGQFVFQAGIVVEVLEQLGSGERDRLFPGRTSLSRLESRFQEKREQRRQAAHELALFGAAEPFELLGDVLDVRPRYFASAQERGLLVGPGVEVAIVFCVRHAGLSLGAETDAVGARARYRAGHRLPRAELSIEDCAQRHKSSDAENVWHRNHRRAIPAGPASRATLASTPSNTAAPVSFASEAASPAKGAPPSRTASARSSSAQARTAAAIAPRLAWRSPISSAVENGRKRTPASCTLRPSDATLARIVSRIAAPSVTMENRRPPRPAASRPHSPSPTTAVEPSARASLNPGSPNAATTAPQGRGAAEIAESTALAANSISAGVWMAGSPESAFTATTSKASPATRLASSRSHRVTLGSVFGLTIRSSLLVICYRLPISTQAIWRARFALVPPRLLPSRKVAKSFHSREKLTIPSQRHVANLTAVSNLNPL